MKKKLGEAKVVKKAKKVGAIAFEVCKANGMFVRKYEVSVHGEKAEQWANNFVAGTNMTVKPIFE